MPDIIKLLPDSVANQIAAGEVVQRPASVVKELLENSIDAGATEIKLIIKDAGRTLVQVTDNGSGMSEIDARMCFERHSTSKINDAKDLFALRTMGFRGEALASIASVARVELKTRKVENPLGTMIIIEGSSLVSQEPCQTNKGTSIAVKNLFFNTPARRNFLKGDNIEKSHIHNEFVRAALPFPEIAFSYYHNNQIVLQSDKGNLNQRIINLFGNNYKSRLIPVNETTEIVALTGFLLKPEFARKKRGEQFFFVNKRFVRSSYLNHAIEAAFEELIPEGSYPSFFVFLQIDPQQIDVNVHPTKTEIKFMDERLIYQILRVAVKRSLGRFNVVPSLDFERETAFDHIRFDKNKPVQPPVIDVDPEFNPFDVKKSALAGKNLTNRANPQQWEKLYPERKVDIQTQAIGTNMHLDPDIPAQTVISADWEQEQSRTQIKKFMHIQGRFIISSIKSGIMIIDQQRAHERILFERHLKMLQNKKSGSQALLFPEQVRLSENDAALLNQIKDEVVALGFGINEINKNNFIVSAVPVELPDNEDIRQVIESILENFRKNQVDVELDNIVNIARSLAKSLSVKHGKIMGDEEMNALADALFSCEMPYRTPSGKPVFTTMTVEELSEKFK